MRILLTNDDGIFAPGLAAMYPKLAKLGDVTVVAPAESRSGASHSITFFKPVLCNEVEIEGQFRGYAVHGSPADCVKLASMQLHDGPIDLVVSGVNNGANVGINVHYSGTVAAAMEAAFLGIPSVAVSLACGEKMDFAAAAAYGMQVIEAVMPLSPGDVININVPPLAEGPPNGVRVVPYSCSGFHEYYVPHKDGEAETFFQLTGGAARDDQSALDTACLELGYITVTALIPDMNDHAKTAAMGVRLEDFRLAGLDP